MKPNTRLLISFTLPSGDIKGWGYDEPYYKTLTRLQQAIIDDFVEWPDHTAIKFEYHSFSLDVTATDNYDLAEQAGNWLMQNGASL